MALNQLENSADILDHALDRSGEPTNGNSEYESQALSLLNEGYRALVDGGSVFGVDVDEDWLWLHKSPPGTITLQPAVNVTYTVNRGSQAVTFGTAPSPDIDTTVLTWLLKGDTRSELYRITAHAASATAASIDSVYVGANAAALAGKLVKLEYNLPSDFLRFYAPLRVQKDFEREITVGSESALDRDYSLRDLQAGVPDRAAFADADTLRFNRYASADMVRVELPYLFEPDELTDSSSSVPLMPTAHFSFLVHYIAHFVSLLKEDFDKAKVFEKLAVASLNKMVQANRKRLRSGQRRFGQIMARQDQLQYGRIPAKDSRGRLYGWSG